MIYQSFGFLNLLFSEVVGFGISSNLYAGHFFNLKTFHFSGFRHEDLFDHF